MPTCATCGKTIDDSDAFCRACGAATGVASPAIEEAGAPSAPVASGVTEPQRSRRTLWLILAGVVAVLAIAAATGGFMLVSGPSADDFVGTWAAGDVGMSGIYVIVTNDSGNLMVSTTYLTDNPAPVPAKIKDDKLIFELPAPSGYDAPPALNADLTMADKDNLRLTVHDDSMGTEATIAILLQRIDGAALKAMQDAQHSEAQDSAVKEGVHSLQIGVQSWAVDHNDLYPPVTEMTPDGEVGSMIDKWPTNPYTGEPMKLGTEPGDFTYTTPADRMTFTLSGHLGDGTDFTVP